MNAMIQTACDHHPSGTGFFRLLARWRARLGWTRRADRLDPERLSCHLLRDLGLDEGRDYPPGRFTRD